VENKNRKDYADAKWEQEVRDSLAKKKTAGTGANLSKQDKALVAAQMAKEAEIRGKIAEIQARLRRGIELVSALVASNAEAVGTRVGEMASLMLESVLGVGSFLLDSRAFEVFQRLGSLSADRLGESRRMLSVSVLRSHDTPFIPDDYLHEPIDGECIKGGRSFKLITFAFRIDNEIAPPVTLLGGTGTFGQYYLCYDQFIAQSSGRKGRYWGGIISE
jgi:hypothetical protein